MKYQIVVVDPPYAFSDKLQQSEVKRGSAANYSTMTLVQLKALPVKDIADPDGCILALWVPSSLIDQGLDLMQTWGFNVKQSYVWCKTKKQPLKSLAEDIKGLDIKKAIKFLKEAKLPQILQFGMGHLWRNCHEIALIGINNTGIYDKLQNKSQRSVCFAPNLKHSQKPEYLQDQLEIMFPNQKYLEMFARRTRKGWTCLGNEIDGQDIKDALNTIIKPKESLITAFSAEGVSIPILEGTTYNSTLN